MSKPKGKADITKIKEDLNKYSREQIKFNEPHVTQRCLLRDIAKEEVIQNLLKPDKLVYAGEQDSKYPDEKNMTFTLSLATQGHTGFQSS